MHNDFGVAVKANGTISVYCSIINNATAEIVENLFWYDREYEHPEEILQLMIQKDSLLVTSIQSGPPIHAMLIATLPLS